MIRHAPWWLVLAANVAVWVLLTALWVYVKFIMPVVGQ